MRARRHYLLTILATGLLSVSNANAQSTVQALPGDPNLVVYSYDPNNSYRVLARPRSVTHIELMPDERVRVLAIGDTVSWQASDKQNHVFIKPVFPNQTTSGTLVTNKRTYQLVLVASDEKGKFFQRVSWQYPEIIARENRDEDLRALGFDSAASSADATPKTELAATRVDPKALNFEYEVDGSGSLRPAQIYDDGATTYIRFDERVTDLPALFRMRDGEHVELVDYAVQEKVLVVPRVLEAGLLKLGTTEVKFRNKLILKKAFFGGYERVSP